MNEMLRWRRRRHKGGGNGEQGNRNRNGERIVSLWAGLGLAWLWRGGGSWFLSSCSSSSCFVSLLPSSAIASFWASRIAIPVLFLPLFNLRRDDALLSFLPLSAHFGTYLDPSLFGAVASPRSTLPLSPLRFCLDRVRPTT